MRVTVIINQGSGAVRTAKGEALAERVRQAFRAQGVDADIRTSAPEGLAAALERAVAEGADALVAGGGDGTISRAAGAVVAAGMTLGVLPLGTLNHFARDAGIPLDLDSAVAAIAAGHFRKVDVADVNGRVFVNTSSVGLYPMMVDAREAQQKRLGRSKRVAMLVASLRALRHFSRKRLSIRIAGREATIETPLLFVGNNRYDTNLLALGARARLDGGELCLYAPLARTRLHFLGLALRGLIGRIDQQRDFIALDGIAEAEIVAAAAALKVSTDGETTLMATPLRYRIHPGALRLLVPPAGEAAAR
jgi:diacylglycerol kinase family enzyme